mgnify:CR=1 FL=1
MENPPDTHHKWPELHDLEAPHDTASGCVQGRGDAPPELQPPGDTLTVTLQTEGQVRHAPADGRVRRSSGGGASTSKLRRTG